MLRKIISSGARLSKFQSIQPIVSRLSLNAFAQLNNSQYSTTTTEAPIKQGDAVLNNSIKFGEETKSLVNKLREQKRYYAVIKVKGKRYTVTENDTIVLGLCSNLKIGDQLKIEQVTELGSKDYSIIGQPFVSDNYYDIQATVVEHTQGPEFSIVKFKKRKGYRREYQYRNHYTLVKIHKLDIKKLE